MTYLLREVGPNRVGAVIWQGTLIEEYCWGLPTDAEIKQGLILWTVAGSAFVPVAGLAKGPKRLTLVTSPVLQVVLALGAGGPAGQKAQGVV